MAMLGGAAAWPVARAAQSPVQSPAVAPQSSLPAVLRRPALATPLAAQSALLAATRVGPRVLVAGERGIVLASDDQGQHWRQAQVPVQVSLTALAAVDEREVWAAGHFGTLLHSTDAGMSWTLVMDGARAARQLLEDAPDEARRQAAQRQVEDGPDKPFFDLAVVDGRVLAVGAYGLALEGRAGRFKALTPLLPNPRQLHLYGIRAAGQRVFVVGEQGLVMRSSDGGASFEALPPPYKGSFFGVLLPADGVVLAFGLRGNIWRSADNGATWGLVANPVPVGIGAGLQRADGSLLLLAQNGDLLVSRDLGQSFQRRPAAPPSPAATLADLPDGQLLVAGLRGLRRQVL
jgi:photosystem II stability/assembly factor-like uncharacterized protein